MTQTLTKEYETVYVLRPDTLPAGVEKVSGRIEETVKKEGGTLTLVETWGRRQLAYPVQKTKRGIYYCVKFLGEGALVTELERQLRLLDPVMKYQTVLVRDEVDTASLAVNPEDVQFEAVEPSDDDEEPTKAEELGLVEAPRRDRGDDRGDRGDAKADGEKKVDGEKKADGDAKADGEKKADGDAKADGEKKAAGDGGEAKAEATGEGGDQAEATSEGGDQAEAKKEES